MNGRSVLVVDDDEEFLAAVTRALQGAGYTVRTLPDGRRVMEMVKERAPDLIITDIMMPERDGIEVISEVKRATRGVRILAMSGRTYIGDMHLLQLAKTLGADDVLAKPFESDQLLAKIEALLKPTRPQDR